ncbi:MAG: CGNR zinc finger domain-containing protein [Candidatus Limnocylindrales bacterium]
MSDPAALDQADLETALDFVNTVGVSHGKPFDDFGTTRQVIDWLHERTGLDPALVPADSTAVLARVARARTAFRELWDATVEQRQPDLAALKEVNRVLRHRSVLELEDGVDTAGHGLHLTSRFTGDEIDCALAELAEPLVRTVGGADAELARICDNDECRWVFFDDSRTHRKRWCDMASCGNRAKAARHRARAKATEPSAGQAAPVTAPERPG